MLGAGFIQEVANAFVIKDHPLSHHTKEESEVFY
jgi:hypothetical protein